MATSKTSAGKTSAGKTSAGKTSAGKKTSVGKKVSIDLIRSRAHEIFLKRAKFGIPGDPESDWLKAEKELSKKQELTK